VFTRQREGAVICTSCGVLVGVNDATCYNCGRRNPGLWGFAPMLRALGTDLGFVPFVIGTCIILFALTLILSGPAIGMRGIMSFLAPSQLALIMFGASGGYPIFVLDRWWTLLSAGWLHGSALHILFNMMWVRQLAPATAEIYGPGRMVVIYTVASIAGFGLSSFAAAYLPDLLILRGGRLTVGASASIFGLLGAVVYYGHRSGSRMAASQALSYALTMGLFGIIMPGIDNYAHLGGFGGGYLAGRFLDPLRPERVDHIVMAIVCLGLSLLSIVVSVVQSMRQLTP